MKVLYDLIQGTPEWHEFKHGKIGGTRSNGIFIDSDTLIHELAAERTEMYVDNDSYESYDMMRGKDLEPLARERLEEYTGYKFVDAGWIESDIDGVGISPDGITECETVAYEGKCPSGKVHVDYCMGGVVPRDHIRQVLHYFTVNPKLEKMFFLSFRPESTVKPLFVVELTLDSVIDIGLTEKGKVSEDRGHGVKEYVATLPVLKTVREWAKLSREKLLAINAKVDTVIEKLEF